MGTAESVALTAAGSLLCVAGGLISVLDKRSALDLSLSPMAEPVLMASGLDELDVDYDEEADVLYINFGPPVPLSESRILENDVVVRCKGERIIGITIPRLKKRRKRAQPDQGS